MTEMPILPQPTFFSAAIDAYLQEISVQAGRHIVFVDLAQAPWKNTQASIDVPSDLPAAAIFVSKKEINPSLYVSVRHDPLLAHEATHLQLNTEGWDKITFKEDASEVLKEKVEAVENWLTDPIINRRIAQRGFSMARNRNEEVKASIKGLQHHTWSQNVHHGRQNPTSMIRLFVSFLLEPDVSKPVKTTFRQAFRTDLPELYEEANALLSQIEQKGFGTPEQYRETAMLCLRQWQVDVETLRFTAIQRFNIEEQQTWLAANPPEDTWE